MQRLGLYLFKRLKLLLLLGFFHSSCNDATSEREILKFSIEPKFISTGNTLGQFYFFNQVRNDSLFLFNVYNHSLDIVDLRVDSLVRSIQFEFNGLNAVNDITGFYYFNEDSIYLAEGNSSVVLLNSKGEIKNRYTDFANSLPRDEIGKLYENFPSLRFSSQLIFNPKRDELLLYFMSFNQPETKRILASYSLKTRKPRSLPIYYPEFYQSKRLDLSKLFLTSATMDDEGFAYTFSVSPKVYRYNYKEDKVSSVDVNPPWEKTYADVIPYGEMSSDQKQVFMAANPFYYKIFYDPYRDMYYRLSSPPRPNSFEPDFHYVNYNRILVSVLNKDFQPISDFFLSKENTYNVGFSFVTSEGLWISYNQRNQDEEQWIKGDLIVLE
ncbi:DUF4221 family protein [Algoriphagus sediminis]|uniref:DUF4221 family protein n=1 Tax=Algoriphagus sediminis TaxID=3057113 RepID=A0ABT7YHF8_9BACT|nr:DUF4221 family protein [Algoriphagus sediminis]MDN3205972.1 DUF4221 family protein [Algoriphagus sediminis]